MVHHPLHSTAFVAQFSCLGDKCEDTCCKSWSMQVDDATYARYESEAPELKEAVIQGADGGHIMRRDEKSDFCVKFTDGLCGIHRDYGSDFLGDACHFYPRVTRKIAGEAVMTGLMSCPEIARIALLESDMLTFNEGVVDRLPETLKDYAPQGLTAEDARSIHAAFIDAALDESYSAAHNMARVVSVAHSLESLDVASWPLAVPFYLKSASERLFAPEPSEVDPFNLLHALMGIVSAAGVRNRARLRDTMADMEKALEVALDWESLGISTTGDSVQAFKAIEAEWNAHYAAQFEPVLHRWIAVQLSVALFPFAGFGADAKERAMILGVRFATVRLALMSACHVAGAMINEAQIIRIVQSLARVLDHLADPELSLKIYHEPGWLREPRLRALIGDN
ncbi:MAG: flagellin lysine-N-methylase [Alphaproteobacteria bacterium]|nr:flagellin lysine-N-methylase [Alphaproteobacteria bacterium]